MLDETDVKDVGDAWRCMTSIAAVQNPVVRVKAVPLRHNSSSSESESDKDCDSDDDYIPDKKRHLPGSGDNKLSDACQKNGANKKYNIWGSVLAEQTLSKDLSGWFGINKKVESDRDVETYDYRNAENDDRPDNIELLTSTQQQNSDDVHFDVSDIGDKETFGMDPTVRKARSSSPDDLRGNRSSDNDIVDDDDVVKKESKVYKKKPQPHDASRPSAKGRLGAAVPSDKKEDHQHVTAKDSPLIVGEEIHRVLREPDHMKITFVRVAEVLGTEKALDLLHQTEYIEESGGLKILNGQRRRTPGGVYLYLLKGDSSVTKENHKEIFKERFEEQKRFQKEAKKRRWNDHVAVIEQSSMQMDEQPSLVDRKDLFLATVRETQPAVAEITTDAKEGRSILVMDDEFGLNDGDVPDIELDL